ncbi:MAG: cobalamin B12-binding domain-containing protein [Phycisphaerae bacterium]
MNQFGPATATSGISAVAPLSPSACAQFVKEFDNLVALAQERLRLEWSRHRHEDLQRLSRELSEDVLEFGRLLRVVFCHGLGAALHDEAAWYLTTLAARGSRQDGFALLLDSWIVAIQGMIKPPECNELAAPLQALREALPDMVQAVGSSGRRNAPAEPDRLVRSIVEGDIGDAEQLLRAALAGRSAPESVVTDLLLPAMAEVGGRWERNDLAIFQEHLATETVRYLLAILPFLVGRRALLEQTALVSCVPGDEHALSPLALGTYLRLRGWPVRLLGGGLPAAEIARAVAALSPHALFLSLLTLSRLEGALEAIESVRAVAPRCRILVGGRGAHTARPVLERSGALVALTFEEAHRLALEEASRA